MIKDLLVKILLAPINLIKRLKGLKIKKYTSYDYFLECVKETIDLNVDFRAEFKTEEINVIINPLKPIRTPRKPQKEVEEMTEEIENVK